MEVARSSFPSVTLGPTSFSFVLVVCSQVPTRREKIEHGLAGLGERDIIFQAPVVQKVDNAMHRINHYLLDSAIGFAMTYPLDSDLSGG